MLKSIKKTVIKPKCNKCQIKCKKCRLKNNSLSKISDKKINKNSGTSLVVRIRNNVIIMNYKCMYSAINSLNLDQLNPRINPGHNVIFLYRNTLRRTISCFLNWCVRHINSENRRWLMKLLKNIRTFNYKLFVNLIKKGEIVKPFKMYLCVLKSIYMKNGHLQPQCNILLRKNVKKINIFIDIDNPSEIIKLKNIIKQEIPKNNKSDPSKINILMDFLTNEENKKFKDILMNIYKDDVIFFGKHDIKI